MLSLFFILTNIAITILIAIGTYAFSESIIISIIVTLLLSGGMQASPFVALLGYPIIEFIFSKNGLSVFSAIVVSITTVQMIVIFFMMKNDRSF